LILEGIDLNSVRRRKRFAGVRRAASRGS